MAHRLETTISDALWAAIRARAQSSGQPIRRVVQEALAEALDVQHHSMFQVSTSGALIEGLYQGALTVGDLRRHGDTGLGTFEELDGEMILVDGHCFQARSDGSVTEASDDTLTPFATVVAFAPDRTVTLRDITSFDDLTSRLDGLRTSDNDFFAWRITGHLDELRMRAACRHASGTPLVEAVSDQAVFDFRDITATIVGFWSPPFSQAISIAGYHLHAVSEDRTRAGHVFDLRAREVIAEVHGVSDLHVALPETEAYLRADLGSTRADMDAIERGRD
ncbi:MAG: acetolactate decarboxylase [Actinobacteria bacterium]|nr:acetolactate decarboxylase [Actinomycetota bacterium]